MIIIIIIIIIIKFSLTTIMMMIIIYYHTRTHAHTLLRLHFRRPCVRCAQIAFRPVAVAPLAKPGAAVLTPPAPKVPSVQVGRNGAWTGLAVARVGWFARCSPEGNQKAQALKLDFGWFSMLFFVLFLVSPSSVCVCVCVCGLFGPRNCPMATPWMIEIVLKEHEGKTGSPFGLPPRESIPGVRIAQGTP